jgi:hypothetical protein
MNHIRHISRLAAVLAGALLAFSAATAAAFAASYGITDAPSSGVPLPCTPQCAAPQPAPAGPHAVVVGGMPGWQITLIAVAAALAAAAVAVLADRARAARQESLV